MSRKILFICGCLENGRDGVGDYSRRLARALEAMGVECRLIAWDDSRRVPTLEANALRLPKTLPLRAKWTQAKAFLEDFVPDFVSLQFVPYSFSPKGLPWEFADEILPLIGQTPVHIFAHELWVMWHGRSTLKARLVGETLQKAIVLNTFKKLSPRLIHAAVPLYREVLAQNGFPAHELPLFGNIPFIPRQTPSAHDPSRRVLGFFGSIAPEMDFDALGRRLTALARATGLKLTLRTSGLVSPKTRRSWEAAQKRWGASIDFEAFGFVPPFEASWYLQSLDWGLSSYSPTFWHKSGSIAAMREHDKPVLLLGKPEYPTREALPEGIYAALTSELLLKTPSFASSSSVEAVARSFVADAVAAGLWDGRDLPEPPASGNV